MQLHGYKRLVVMGHPGAGKTTFVKHIVYKWAAGRNEKKTMLHNFLFVIPIILRLVKPESDLTDILREQLSLNKLHICIIQHALKQSSSLMLVLDGYDEIRCQGIIQKIIRKEEFPNATVIITTRPHGLPLIQQLRYGAVQMLVEIIGFNKKQIKNYIEKFMKTNGQKVNDELFRQISSDDHLLKIAANPTQLEIICFVWLKRGNLGNRLSDLFRVFLISLLKHTRRKMDFQLKVLSDEDLLQQNGPLLRKIARMANTWNESGYLQTIFGYEELEACLGEYLEKAKQLGCIVKYNPSKSEESSDWSFTHLTLQYYFIAYFLSESTKEDARQFAECCSPIQHMDTLRGIMAFLCSMDAEAANIILQSYAWMTHDKKECLKLQKFLCQLVKEYKHEADINIPLPHYVLWTQEDTESLKILLDSDKTNHKNMKYLEVKRFTNEMKEIDLSYVPNVSVCLRHQEEIGIMARSIAKASRLQKLNLVLPCKGTDETEVEKLIRKVPVCLSEIYISGHNILQPVSKGLSCFKHVRKVHLKDKLESTGQESCFFKNISCFSNADISVEQELLDPCFFPLEYSGRLKLISFGTRKDHLEQVKGKIMDVDKKDFNNIKSLNLSGSISRPNELSSQGDTIGLLLVKLLNMEILRMDFCKLDSEFLLQMAHRIESENGAHHLKCLTMNGNNLKDGGAELRQILRFTSNLTILELGDCQLGDKDFDQISQEEPQISQEEPLVPGLKVLNVSGNVFEKSSSRGIQVFMKNKPQLNVLNMGWCNMDASITDSVFSDTQLQSLQVLDLQYNPLGDSGLHSLAPHVSKMPCLKILNLSCCGCSDAKKLAFLCRSIPPSLEELDVRSNLFEKSIVNVS